MLLFSDAFFVLLLGEFFFVLFLGSAFLCCFSLSLFYPKVPLLIHILQIYGRFSPCLLQKKVIIGQKMSLLCYSIFICTLSYIFYETPSAFIFSYMFLSFSLQKGSSGLNLEHIFCTKSLM